MAWSFIAVILICPAALAVPDCDIRSADDVMQGPGVQSVYGCGFVGQAIVASTALGPGLGKDQYLKIVCTPRERLQVIGAIDRDGDGVVRSEEVTAYVTERFTQMDSHATHQIGVDQYCGTKGPVSAAQLDYCRTRFASIDADGDEAIDLGELQNFYLSILKTADLNGDGQVTIEEWLATCIERKRRAISAELAR